MTILTPNFAEAKTNGQAGALHVVAAPATPPHAATFAIKSPLKVAIIGTAPSSRMLAPFNDPSWTIWCCSPGNMNTMPRVDVWFELHSNLLWAKHASYGAPYLEWLKQQQFPIFMQDQSQVPTALTFPMFEVVHEFGDEFFTSSFAWMMAFAIKCGAVEIALYGVDMASKNEYILQRPGFYHFKREAMKRGIKVSAPHESDIMQSPPLYGYVDSTPFGRKIQAREDEITDRVTPMTQQRDQLNHNITYLQGAQEDVDYFKSIWSGVANENVLLKGRIAQLEAETARLSQQLLSPSVAEPVMVADAKPKQRRPRAAREVVAPGPVTLMDGQHG